MKTLLQIDAMLLALALVQAIAAILVFKRFRAALLGFFVQSFLLVAAPTILIASPSSAGETIGWSLLGAFALLYLWGFRSWRRLPSAPHGSAPHGSDGSAPHGKA